MQRNGSAGPAGGSGFALRFRARGADGFLPERGGGFLLFPERAGESFIDRQSLLVRRGFLRRLPEGGDRLAGGASLLRMGIAGGARRLLLRRGVQTARLRVAARLVVERLLDFVRRLLHRYHPGRRGRAGAVRMLMMLSSGEDARMRFFLRLAHGRGGGFSGRGGSRRDGFLHGSRRFLRLYGGRSRFLRGLGLGKEHGRRGRTEARLLGLRRARNAHDAFGFVLRFRHDLMAQIGVLHPRDVGITFKDALRFVQKRLELVLVAECFFQVHVSSPLA